MERLRRNERGRAVDPIILGEVRFVILLLPAGRRRTRLERWFEEVVARLYSIPWDAATGLRWAQLLASVRASGRSMPIKDSLIAATALAHDLTIATLDQRDFEAAGVTLVDPSAADADLAGVRRSAQSYSRGRGSTPVDQAMSLTGLIAWTLDRCCEPARAEPRRWRSGRSASERRFQPATRARDRLRV